MYEILCQYSGRRRGSSQIPLRRRLITNPRRVLRYLSRSTLDIMGSAGESISATANSGFGYEFNSLHNPDDPFANAYATIFHQTSGTRILNLAINYLPFLAILPFPRVLEVAAARKSIVTHAKKLVHQKEAQEKIGNDLLSLMIAENRKAEGKLAEMELVDQVMTFLLAGHETTSTAVGPLSSPVNVVMLDAMGARATSGYSGAFADRSQRFGQSHF